MIKEVLNKVFDEIQVYPTWNNSNDLNKSVEYDFARDKKLTISLSSFLESTETFINSFDNYRKTAEKINLIEVIMVANDSANKIKKTLTERITKGSLNRVFHSNGQMWYSEETINQIAHRISEEYMRTNAKDLIFDVPDMWFFNEIKLQRTFQESIERVLMV